MANQVLRLYVDTARRALVVSDRSTQPAPRLGFTQGDTVTLVITLLEPNASGGISSPYSKVSVSGLTVRLGIGTPSASTGSSAPSIYQNSFTADTTANTLTGTLYVTPSAVQTLLGSNVTGESTLEIEIAESGNYFTAYSGPVTLYAELIEAAGATPSTPGDTYMTTGESIATFVRKSGAAGESITLTSPDGTKQVILYIDNTGTFHADVV